MIYRDDLAATRARLDALERQAGHDQRRIASLEAQLAAARSGRASLPGYPLPPRANAVLAVGILSLVLCNVLGPFAWSLGTEELRRIDRGLTSPHGRSTAAAGRVLGIVSTCVMCACLLLIAILVAIAPR